MTKTGQGPRPIDPEVKIFGATVAALRARAGLTQAQLAKASGIHEKVIGTIEQGIREVGISKVRMLANGLGVQPGDLFKAINDSDDEPR